MGRVRFLSVSLKKTVQNKYITLHHHFSPLLCFLVNEIELWAKPYQKLKEVLFHLKRKN